MNDKPNADDVMNAVGAMAEMSWIFYSTAMEKGFSAVQAFQLTQTYLSGLMKPPASPPDEADGG